MKFKRIYNFMFTSNRVLLNLTFFPSIEVERYVDALLAGYLDYMITYQYICLNMCVLED